VVPTGIRVQLCHGLTAPTQHDLATSPQESILCFGEGTDQGRFLFMFRGAPMGHDSSGANFAQGAMKGQWPLSKWGLRCQGVEQFGRSEAFVSGLDYHLSFLDHVHEFHTS
jgi:hypothetical protein